MLDFFNKRGALNVGAVKRENVFSWPLELEGRDSEGESKGWETGFLPKWEKSYIWGYNWMIWHYFEEVIQHNLF